MILDTYYHDAVRVVPLRDWEQIQQSGVIGLHGLDNLIRLAEAQGLSVTEVKKPFFCLPGCRYIMMLASEDPCEYHTVSVDESGVVLDPDTRNTSGKHWSEYSPVAMLEFRHS